jgi:hypothetical protein
MSDALYAIDTTTPSLVELPAQTPNLLTYTLRQQPTNSTIIEVMVNFTGEELAILHVQARGQSLNGTGSTYTVGVHIEGTSFASLVIPAVGGSSTSFAPLWSADVSDPPVLGVGQELFITGTQGSGPNVAVDFCMIPSSQLPLLGG